MIPSRKPIYVRVNPLENKGKKYKNIGSASYFSERYRKWVHVDNGFLSDGATWAFDIPESWSWWVHDVLCEYTVWSDGSPCSAQEASRVLYDILDEEGRHIRKWAWRVATFLFGSWKIKQKVGWV